jgi:hypothetical protein
MQRSTGGDTSNEGFGGERIGTPGRIAWAFGFGILTLLLRMPFIQLPFGQQDEGYYAAVARASAAGAKLYADTGYVRPPVLNAAYLVAYRVADALGTPYDLTLRALAALVAATTVAIFAGFVLKRLDLLPAAIGSLLAALAGASFALQNEANAETWLMLPYTCAALLLWVAMEQTPSRRQTLLVLGAGALLGVAALFKEVALVGLALPLTGVVLIRSDERRRWLTLTLVSAGGAALVGLSALGLLALSGQVRDFLYHTWFTRLVYVSDTHATVSPLTVLRRQLDFVNEAFVVPLVAGVAAYATAVAVARRSWSDEVRLAHYAFAWLALSAIGVAASGRFYQHYFIQMTVPLALLVATSLAAVLKTQGAPAVARALATGMALLAVGVPTVGFARDIGEVPGFAERRGIWPALAAQVDERMPEGDRLFVWGTFASLRAYADAAPATDVVWVYYAFGEPGGDVFLGRTFPSVGDRLLADLERTPPDTIVLTSPLGDLLPGARGSALDSPDDARVETALLNMIESEFEETMRADEYVVYERRR